MSDHPFASRATVATTHQINVRCTEDEHEIIVGMAAKHKMSRSDYVRQAIEWWLLHVEKVGER